MSRLVKKAEGIDRNQVMTAIGKLDEYKNQLEEMQYGLGNEFNFDQATSDALNTLTQSINQTVSAMAALRTALTQAGK